MEFCNATIKRVSILVLKDARIDTRVEPRYPHSIGHKTSMWVASQIVNEAAKYRYRSGNLFNTGGLILCLMSFIN